MADPSVGRVRRAAGERFLRSGSCSASSPTASRPARTIAAATEDMAALIRRSHGWRPQHMDRHLREFYHLKNRRPSRGVAASRLPAHHLGGRCDSGQGLRLARSLHPRRHAGDLRRAVQRPRHQALGGRAVLQGRQARSTSSPPPSCPRRPRRPPCSRRLESSDERLCGPLRPSTTPSARPTTLLAETAARPGGRAGRRRGRLRGCGAAFDGPGGLVDLRSSSTPTSRRSCAEPWTAMGSRLAEVITTVQPAIAAINQEPASPAAAGDDLDRRRSLLDVGWVRRARSTPAQREAFEALRLPALGPPRSATGWPGAAARCGR